LAPARKSATTAATSFDCSVFAASAAEAPSCTVTSLPSIFCNPLASEVSVSITSTEAATFFAWSFCAGGGATFAATAAASLRTERMSSLSQGFFTKRKISPSLIEPTSAARSE
jgi:hypothetical protein